MLEQDWVVGATVGVTGLVCFLKGWVRIRDSLLYLIPRWRIFFYRFWEVGKPCPCMLKIFNNHKNEPSIAESNSWKASILSWLLGELEKSKYKVTWYTA